MLNLGSRTKQTVHDHDGHGPSWHAYVGLPGYLAYTGVSKTLNHATIISNINAEYIDGYYSLNYLSMTWVLASAVL